MAVAEEVKQVTIEDSLDLGLVGITVRNQGGRSYYLGRPWSSEILEGFPDGRFNNSQYNVKGIDPSTNIVFSEGDDFEVRLVTYRGDKTLQDLRFEAYVSLGRPEKIRVEEVRTITGA